jgi:hypothetical protein
MAYGRGVLVAVGGGDISVSKDLEHFVPLGSEPDVGRPAEFGLSSGNGLALASDGSALLASTNGFVWTQRLKPSGFSDGRLAFANDRFLLFNTDIAAQNVAISTNGSDWETFGGLNWGTRAVAFGNGTYVFVGAQGTIRTTKNFLLWFNRTSGTGLALASIAWGNGVFIAVGNLSAVSFALVSDNGSDWAYRSLAAEGGVWSIAFGNGQFVAVGPGGKILTTTDGAVWDARNSGTSRGINNVVFDGARFVAVGDGGVALQSIDGINWTDISGSDLLTFVQVASIGGTAVANAVVSGTGGSTQLFQSPSFVAAAPSIVVEPASQQVAVGGVVEFGVGVVGSAPIGYQWASNSVPILGRTNAALILINVSADTAALYSVTVSNALGSVTSQSAALSVAPFTGYETVLKPIAGPGGISLEFVGSVGVRYEIQNAGSITTPVEWVAVTNLVLSSPWFSMQPDLGNLESKFFRTVVLP